jgi:signal transduction histidine kinase
VAGARLHGVLTFGTRSATNIEEDEIAVLDLVAGSVAAAMERRALVAELRARADELKEADARKDQFLAMLGHELRNPLAPVLNAVKLMQQRDGGDRVIRRSVAAAHRQIRHMTRLLDDLLDVSRIRNGKIELRRSPIDLRVVIQDALHAVESVVEERGHALSVEAPEQPLLVDGDPVRLSQVLENLLHNAAKYTDRGGHLALEVRPDGDQILLQVRDDGIGLDPAMLPRIFDMFVQAEQGSDRARGGLGLGLTLVRNLVEMHGGRITARSDGPGRGSEFEVRLPALTGAHVLRVEASPPPRIQGATRPLDIVLVDDNADIRDTLRSLLELGGHHVAEAEDGRSAVELIRATAPSIAFIDIGLPGMDGYQVARELRGVASPTCLIAMTGYGRAEDRRQALDAGFDAHLVKPVDFDDLTKLLEELPSQPR